MRAGLMRHRITIKQPSVGRDETTGDSIETYTDLSTVWANVGFASGRERWANEHTITNYDAVVSVRYLSTIKEDMQIHYDGRILEIKSIIDPLGNKAELKLLCVDHG